MTFSLQTSCTLITEPISLHASNIYRCARNNGIMIDKLLNLGTSSDNTIVSSFNSKAVCTAQMWLEGKPYDEYYAARMDSLKSGSLNANFCDNSQRLQWAASMGIGVEVLGGVSKIVDTLFEGFTILDAKPPATVTMTINTVLRLANLGLSLPSTIIAKQYRSLCDKVGGDDRNNFLVGCTSEPPFSTNQKVKCFLDIGIKWTLGEENPIPCSDIILDGDVALSSSKYTPGNLVPLPAWHSSVTNNHVVYIEKQEGVSHLDYIHISRKFGETFTFLLLSKNEQEKLLNAACGMKAENLLKNISSVNDGVGYDILNRVSPPSDTTIKIINDNILPSFSNSESTFKIGTYHGVYLSNIVETCNFEDSLVGRLAELKYFT